VLIQWSKWSIVVNVNIYMMVKVIQRSKVVKVVNSGQSGYCCQKWSIRRSGQ
jgi:hypothetical protein